MTNKKTITFLSSRGRGIGAQMSVLRRYLREREDGADFVFRTFSKNERLANDRAGQGNSKLRRRFLAGADNIVCVDQSLVGNNYGEDSVRILMASPYEYQFRMALEAGQKEKKSGAFKKFTHIIPGSPFTEKLLEKAYDLPDTAILSGCALPFAWEVCHERMQREMREKLGFYYPQIKEKKVIAVILSGPEEKNQKFLEAFDLKDCLDRIRGEYFVLTNSGVLVGSASALDAGYSDCFGFVSRIWKSRDMLAVADVLVTNNGWMASAFAGKRKPVFCPLAADLWFERYMQKNFVGMCADKIR